MFHNDGCLAQNLPKLFVSPPGNSGIIMDLVVFLVLMNEVISWLLILRVWLWLQRQTHFVKAPPVEPPVTKDDLPVDQPAINHEFDDLQVIRIKHEGTPDQASSRQYRQNCSVCSDSYPVEDYPQLEECSHWADTCRDCFSAWLTVQIDSTSWDQIRCPGECDVIIPYEAVRELATPETFER
jgi:hypothetical protein